MAGFDTVERTRERIQLLSHVSIRYCPFFKVLLLLNIVVVVVDVVVVVVVLINVVVVSFSMNGSVRPYGPPTIASLARTSVRLSVNVKKIRLI